MKAIDDIKDWIQKFVIKLNLCPFASRALIDDETYFVCVNDQNEEALLLGFWNAIQKLKDSTSYKSAVIIFPESLTDFESYLDLLDKSNWLLEDTHLSEIFQLASFHPKYVFEGSTEHDPSNYTNRSPLPMIHVLSVDQVELSIKNHPDTKSIPIENIKKMEVLGITGILKILNS